MKIATSLIVLFPSRSSCFIVEPSQQRWICRVTSGYGSVANSFQHRYCSRSRHPNKKFNQGETFFCRSHAVSKPQPPLAMGILCNPSSSRENNNDGDNEILSMDATTLSNAIQMERIVSCEQLMRATLDRIDEINPRVNAIILLRDRDALLEEARDRDRELEKNDESLGWLHGIPIAIKDVSNAKGLPTTMGGSPLICSGDGALQPVASSDSYVEHIAREGAIVIGKTNAPEGGLGSNTFNDKWGNTLNPFVVEAATATDNHATATKNNNNTSDDTPPTQHHRGGISAGGSSGGAAVAVVTRMLVMADGTDNMGSLRNPAGWNDIYSLRPTAGLVPQQQPPSSSAASSVLPHPASTPGPMARTPLDCARLLQTMVGDTDRFDAGRLWKKKPSGTASDVEGSEQVVRIGWLGDWGGRLPMEDGILSTCWKALEDWSAASSKVGNKNDNDKIYSHASRIVLERFPAGNDESKSLFDFDKLWEGYNAIRFASTHEKYSQQFDVDRLLSSSPRTLVKEELAWELEEGRAIDAAALHRAGAVYEEYEEWLRGVFSSSDDGTAETNNREQHPFDVLALPSAQVWPFPIDDRYPKTISGIPMDTYHRWMEVCIPVTLGGLPCATIPAGFGNSNNDHKTTSEKTTKLPPLPIGIQLFGKKGDDLELLRLANEFYEYSSTRRKAPK